MKAKEHVSHALSNSLAPKYLLKSASKSVVPASARNTAVVAPGINAKHSNKIAPEYGPQPTTPRSMKDTTDSTSPAPNTNQLQRELLRAQTVRMLDNKYVSIFMTGCTTFALFGDDIRAGFLDKSADLSMFNALFACFVFFFIELCLAAYARQNYLNRGLGFNFYLDLISTLSIIPDVDWIWSPLLGSSSSSSAAQATALKAGRASRAGTKAGRIVRLIRLFRMIRIVRVLRSKNEEHKVEISEPSKIGKVLTEKTNRRLIILVLLIIIISPIIDGTADLTYDDFQVTELERLHRCTQDYNSSGSITPDHFREIVSQYIRDSNGLILNMEIANFDNHLLKTWIFDLRFQPLTAEHEWNHSAPYTLTRNPKTGWSARYWTSDPSLVYRPGDYQTIQNYGCYVDGKCVDCSSNSRISPCHSLVTYSVRSIHQTSGKYSLLKTLVVMFCFGISILVLTKDAEVMVIGPIERMMRLVKQLAENPLGATEAKRELYERDENSVDDYETRMLEQTLGKIGRLLQVGFGAAGTEIIAKNMGGAGELDVMIPGKKITSIFGFGIIEHFTETCSLLEEDIITYINTIAEIVHGDAKIFHGAANKNIGAAFLLAWKICDGALPGMRDPRDPADTPIMSAEEKIKRRENIFVLSAGNAKLARLVRPTELVDSALTAVLCMRVNIHNANAHGSLQKFTNNPKLMAAFEDFEVHLGFGLHIGWAIEGAIGSRYKIDASYLSPNVNMAARLEAATGQFDVPMLLSEWFVEELSPQARKYCRKVDRVAVKGSDIPMDLWTFDIGTYPSTGIQPGLDENGTQKPVRFAEDPVYASLQQAIPREFFDCFRDGIGAYFAGRWSRAKQMLHRANDAWEDGPTKVILKVMDQESHGTFNAPDYWKGFRQLTEK